MRLVIVGVGLIGGSLALALKQSGFATEIIGTGRSAEPLQKAVDMGALDGFSTDISEAAKGADVVMITVPMSAMKHVMRSIRDSIGPDTIVTDGGSVKGSFIEDAREMFGSLANVVPGHPIAGNENSGINAAFPTLYNDRRVILTPTPETEAVAVQTVTELWQRCGAVVEIMDAEEHDRVLAATSHLPHVLAYSLVDALIHLPEREAIFRYAAGGFRDFTRIASSDPVMWRDICLSNRDMLLAIIDHMQSNFAHLREMIESADGDALLEVFTRTKTARDNHYE